MNREENLRFFSPLMCNNDEFSVDPECVFVFGERGYKNGFISLPV